MYQVKFILLVIVFLIVLPLPCLAYRPFVSTDADVSEKGKFEIELGYFGFEKDGNVDTLVTPNLRLNYGILKNTEFVGEFQIKKEEGNNDFEITDGAFFFKSVLIEGYLQGIERLGLALEIGALFPTTLKDEKKVGFESIGILTGKINPFIYHINFGFAFNRRDFDPQGIWGFILESPVFHGLRVVGEINGETIKHESPDNSFLVGLIWEPEFIKADFDFGMRWGLTEGAPDLSLTAGITFSF